MFYSTVNMIIMSHKKGKTIVFGVYDVKSKAGTQQKISYECKNCRSSNRFPWSMRMRALRNGQCRWFGGLETSLPIKYKHYILQIYSMLSINSEIINSKFRTRGKTKKFINREHLKKGSVLRIRFRLIRIRIQSFSLSY